MVCLENSQKPPLSTRTKTISAKMRTLDDLPMKWNRTDSVRAAGKCRETMSARSTCSYQAQRTSHCLLTESKRLFDDAFQRAKSSQKESNDSDHLPPVPRSSNRQGIRSLDVQRDDSYASVRDTMRSSCSSRSHRPGLQNTGPTVYGSPLYNSMSQTVLDRIHMKPVLSEPPPEYFRATPDIEKCLKESNNMFRVTKTSSLHESTTEDPHSARTGDSFSKFILVPNRPHGSRSGSLTRPALKPVSQLLKEEPMKESDTVSLSDGIPHIHVEQSGGIVEDINDSLNQHQKQGNHLRLHLADKALSATSNKSRQESNKGSALKPKPSPRFQQNNVKQTEKEKSKKSKPVKDEEEDESTTDRDFPDFICPSSEMKSREAYTRQWIRQNTFTKCNRFVPLA